tara:strand:+ start:194 stop:376 length:183 start_codon:yes stop_codon:yes gene_type:complete
MEQATRSPATIVDAQERFARVVVDAAQERFARVLEQVRNGDALCVAMEGLQLAGILRAAD